MSGGLCKSEGHMNAFYSCYLSAQKKLSQWGLQKDKNIQYRNQTKTALKHFKTSQTIIYSFIFLPRLSTAKKQIKQRTLATHVIILHYLSQQISIPFTISHTSILTPLTLELQQTSCCRSQDTYVE